MKVLWIVEQHTVAVPGQYVAKEQHIKHSSAMDNSM